MKSSATNYPHTTEGGSTKVVKLIRENEDGSYGFGNTSRTEAMNSVIKGLNQSNG